MGVLTHELVGGSCVWNDLVKERVYSSRIKLGGWENECTHTAHIAEFRYSVVSTCHSMSGVE